MRNLLTIALAATRLVASTTRLPLPPPSSSRRTAFCGGFRPPPPSLRASSVSSSSPSPSTVAHEGYEELERWLVDRGGGHSGVTVSVDSGGGRGLVASRDVVEGEVLLTVPLSACLSTVPVTAVGIEEEEEEEEEEEMGGTAPKWTAPLPKKAQLAVRVLHERRRHETHDDETQSSWIPYLNSWPDFVPNLPENLPDDVLRREAQCDTLLADVRSRLVGLEEQHRLALSLSPDNHDTDEELLPFPSFRNAVQLVGSRSIRLSRARSVLVPLLDMANHCEDPSASYEIVWNDDDGGGGGRDRDTDRSIQLVAARGLEEGEDVTISYGNHCNRQTAGCYGFVVEGSEHDFEFVSLLEILKAAVDAGAISVPDTAEEEVDTKREVEYIFSVVEKVSALGIPTTNLRLLPNDALDGTLWLALRAALAVWTSDPRTDTPDTSSDAYRTLVDVLDAVDADEADADDLWETDSDADAAWRAGVLRDALEGELARRIGGGATTTEEDEVILDELGGTKEAGTSARILVELRRERKRLVWSAARGMGEAAARSEGALEVVAGFLRRST